MKILVAQQNPLVGDLEGNTQKILASLEKGREHRVDLVLFSELALCGYPPEDLVFHHAFIESMECCLARIVKASKGLALVVGLVRMNRERGEKHLFNSVAVVWDGQLLGFQDKWLLPTYDVFDERRYFEPGKEMHPWKLCGKNVGLLICEDIWQHGGYVHDTRYSRDPVEELAKYEMDVLLTPAASPYQCQKVDLRVNVCMKAAKTLHCPVVMCCQVGANGQIVFDGYSVYVNGQGVLSQLGKGFREDDMIVDLNTQRCPCPFHYDELSNLLRALILGVRDYFAKCGFQKACLGLSGGIDSALVAYIATEALGKENVLGVSMPSCYTQEQSKKDARDVAENIGMKWVVISIENPFDGFLDLLGPFFKEKPPDVTEENLQARIRGMILMALSNKEGYIVLSTGNKSEVALGYATLYGDMCGGLGVIGDVIKTRVYALCHYINRIEKREVIPASTLAKPPSAELRPEQKDLDSLPEYGIVDQVLEGHVENCLSIDDIAKKYHISSEVVSELVHKIHDAEYKRRQGPPILRVSQKSFGRGRRYPLVHGWL